jgi:protein subunit release factor B
MTPRHGHFRYTPSMDFPVPLPPATIELAARLGVRPEDITEEFLRGSGAGGQKVNKTSSNVRLVHVPSGIEVRVQKYREQSKNRLSAYKLLVLKVEEVRKGKASKIAQKVFKLRKQKKRRSRKAKEKMLEAKHHRSDIKEGRKSAL